MDKLTSAINQAKRYGQLIAHFEDNGMEEDRRRTKAAWDAFKKQFYGSALSNAVLDGYYEMYCA